MSLNFFYCFAVLTWVHLFNFFSWRRGIKNLRRKTWHGQQSCFSTKFLPRTFTPFSLARFFFSINRNIFSPSVGMLPFILVVFRIGLKEDLFVSQCILLLISYIVFWISTKFYIHIQFEIHTKVLFFKIYKFNCICYILI